MKKWLSEKEAQEYLGVSRSTLYRWQKEGKLKVYKLGRQRRYRQKDLDALLEPYSGVGPIHAAEGN